MKKYCGKHVSAITAQSKHMLSTLTPGSELLKFWASKSEKPSSHTSLNCVLFAYTNIIEGVDLHFQTLRSDTDTVSGFCDSCTHEYFPKICHRIYNFNLIDLL